MIQPYQDDDVWAHATYIYSGLVEVLDTCSVHSKLTKTCTKNDIPGSPFHCWRYGNVDESFNFRKVDIFSPCGLLTTGFWDGVAKIWGHDNMTKNKEGTLYHQHTFMQEYNDLGVPSSMNYRTVSAHTDGEDH